MSLYLHATGKEMKKEPAILIIWTLILLGILLAPIGDIATHIPGGFRHWDKIAHFGLFGITGIVSAYGAKFLGPLRARLAFGMIFGLSLAVFTEGAQHFIGARTGSFLDLLADVAGLSLALLLYALRYLR
ncbi:MAG: VanZ family protein [Dehalococcoidia bacterium]